MRPLAKALFPFIVFCISLGSPPLLLKGEESQPRPRWWLDNGICFAGNWEPLAFRVRRGGLPTDFRARYEAEHSPENIKKLRDCGVNMIITHFYKGLGTDTEAQDLAWTAKLAGACRDNGMRVGAYIGSTLFSETLFREIPGSANWVQLDRRGEPIIYSGQYFRERADFTVRGYREQIKAVVTRAITEYRMDLIHFDNFYTMFPLEAGFTDHIQELFRQYLNEKYTPEQRKERLGFEDVSLIKPPPVPNRPMNPVDDPLTQEWIEFRVVELAGFVRELSDHIRSLNPQTIVEINPHGIWGENSAYTNGMDHARLLPLIDIFWSEDPDHAHYYPDENRLVSKIRSYKLARHFGNALFTYLNNPLEVAEALAFNRMCLGDVGYDIARSPGGTTDARCRFIDFFHKNKQLYRGLEELVDVGVMRDFASMTFGGWVPFLSTVQAEQALIQNRVPFTLLFDQDWDRLDNYKVVVLAAQENLEDKEIALLKKYVESGGALAVVGTTGRYDQRRRERSVQDDFWRLLGATQISESPDRPARISLGAGKIFYLPRFQNHPSVPATADRVQPDYWHLPLNAEEFLEGLLWCRGGQFTVTVETRPHVAATFYRQQRTRQVHLVNYWPGHPVRYIPVLFSEKGFKASRATLYSPEHQPLSLEVGQSGGNPLVLVPGLDTYANLVLE